MKRLLFPLLLLPFAASSQCTASGSLFNADYTLWGAQVTDMDNQANSSTVCTDGRNGMISFPNSNTCSFSTARCGHMLRANVGIPVVSDNSWTMDFKLTIVPSPKGGGLPTNSPAVNLAVLSAGFADLVTSCAIPVGGDNCTSCGVYPNTNMDAIWVQLNSPAPNGCSGGTSGWYFQAFARDGSGSSTASGQIPLAANVFTYYIRLTRSNGNAGMLSVYTDATYSTHVNSSSPSCFAINGSVTGLNVLSHGVAAQGSCFRVFNGSVSQLKIDNGNICPTGLFPSFYVVSCNRSPTQPPNVLIVDGSASFSTPSSIPISAHYWEVIGLDLYGNPIPGQIISHWLPGAPSGPYTFSTADANTMASWYGASPTSAIKIRIKLAIQSCGNVWSETTIEIYCRSGTRIAGEEDDLTANTMKMFPSPGNGDLFIISNSGTGENSLLLVQDLSGRTVSAVSVSMQNGEGRIHLDLESGIYLAGLYDSQGKLIGQQKIVIYK